MASELWDGGTMLDADDWVVYLKAKAAATEFRR